MGPYVGPIALLILLPVTVVGSAALLRGAGWTTLPAPLSAALASRSLSPLLAAASWASARAALASAFSWRALAVYLGWLAFQAALYLVVPGRVARGAPLRDGSTLAYPINGWRCLLLTAAAAAAVHVWVAPLTWVLDNFLQLATAATLVSAALSAALYAASLRRGAALAAGGATGVRVYDFFMGRELNPRLAGIDLKYFCELRPGLFAWLLVDAACALRAAAAPGGLGAGLALVLAMQALYVADAVYCEEAILTTMDITMDGFGFMLAFGDLAWVPAMYSLQARFLAGGGAGAPPPPPPISAAYAAACAAVAAAGFYIFRAANAQKDLFKRDPRHASLRGLATIATPAGTSTTLATGCSPSPCPCPPSPTRPPPTSTRSTSPSSSGTASSATNTSARQSTAPRGQSTRSACRIASSRTCTSPRASDLLELAAWEPQRGVLTEKASVVARAPKSRATRALQPLAAGVRHDARKLARACIFIISAAAAAN